MHTDSPQTLDTALQAVASWTDLGEQRRRDLKSATLKIAKLLESHPSIVPLTVDTIRPCLFGSTGAEFSISDKRLQNMRAAIRYVMRRLGVIDRDKGPVSGAWDSVLALLDARKRAVLLPLARFCSGRKVDPTAFDIEILREYGTHLSSRTLTGRPRKTIGILRTRWNYACRKIEGWPDRILPLLTDERQYILPLDKFPAVFRQDLERFADRLRGIGPGGDIFDLPDAAGTENASLLYCTRPLRDSSVELRLSHARWAASALVASGTPIERIVGLETLVSIENATAILRYLYNREGRKPSAGAMHVAEVIRIASRYHVQVGPAELDELKRLAKVVSIRYLGMTEKNEKTIRKAMDPACEAKLLQLPAVLSSIARQTLATNPVQAAQYFWRALAIEILTAVPLRLANLCGLRLDRHLYRANPGRGLFTAILIQEAETKNKRAITLPLPRSVGEMIEVWLRDYRHHIASPVCGYLFAGYGPGDRAIGHQAFRDGVKNVTAQFAGVPLSPHQFRHLSARRFLDACPGEYELVRHLLVHASVATTIRHYSGTEGEAAAQRFDALIVGKRRTLANGHPLKAKPQPVRAIARRAR